MTVEVKDVEKKEEATTPKPHVAPSPVTPVNPTSYELPIAEKEAMIEELMLMGFDRPMIEKCLAASFYNKERAIEYLVSVD